jgi:hypothetical protein
MIHHRRFVHDMKNLLGIIVGYSSLLLDELPSDDERRLDVDEIRKASEDALARLDEWFKTTQAQGDAAK